MILVINILLWVLVVAVVLFLIYRHRLLRRQLDFMLMHLQLRTEHPLLSLEKREAEMELDGEQDETRMLSDSDRNFIHRLTEYVNEEMMQGRVRIDLLASKMCLSRSQLNRKVHAITGMSTMDFTLALRMRQACRLLREKPDATISQIAQQSGFDDPGYFARTFRRQMGMAPSEYRRIQTTT